MYGPVTTWVQAILFSVFPSAGQGLILKLWAVGTIALTSFLVADLGRVAPANFRISQSLTFAASVTWTLTSPEILSRSLLPWPPLLASLLLVMMLYFHSLGKTLFLQGRQAQSAILFSVSGLFLGILPFVRISLGGYAIITLLLITVVGISLKIPAFRFVAIFSSIGGSLSFLLVLFVLGIQGSLFDFYNQSVLGALIWAEVNFDYWQPTTKIPAIFLFMLQRELGLLVAAAVTLAGIAVLRRRRGDSYAALTIIFRLTIGISFLAIAIAASSSFGTMVKALRSVSVENVFAAGASFLTPNDRLAYLVMFTALLAAGIQVVQSFRHQEKNRLRHFWDADSVLLASSLIGYTQIFPTWDSFHVWWGGALAAILIFRTASPFLENQRSRLLPSLMVSIYFLFSIFVQATLTNNFKQHLFAAPVGTTAEGLLVTEDKFFELLEIQRLLESAQSLGGDLDFLVHDGGVASLTGSYLDDNQWFVDWDFLEAQRGPINASLLIVDREMYFLAGSEEVETWAPTIGYRIENCVTKYCLLSKLDDRSPIAR